MSALHPRALPTVFGQFVEGLTALYPETHLEIVPVGGRSGVWWVEVACDPPVTVQWSEAAGFRLEAYIGEEEQLSSYGTPPREHYASSERALARMTQLIAPSPSTQLGSVALREVRELHGLSQTELASKLGIQQAAVSRVERRSDLRLDTLSAIIQALGGTLDIRARFPDCEMPLSFAAH
jgi:DNA-binding XRE family transcriptional regulator